MCFFFGCPFSLLKISVFFGPNPPALRFGAVRACKEVFGGLIVREPGETNLMKKKPCDIPLNPGLLMEILIIFYYNPQDEGFPELSNEKRPIVV